MKIGGFKPYTNLSAEVEDMAKLRLFLKNKHLEGFLTPPINKGPPIFCY